MALASEATFKQAFRKKATLYGWFAVTLTPPPVGMPDVMLLKGGKTVFVELKFKKNTVSRIQNTILELLSEKKFCVYVINKLDRELFEVYNYNNSELKEYRSLDNMFNAIMIDAFLD